MSRCLAAVAIFISCAAPAAAAPLPAFPGAEGFGAGASGGRGGQVIKVTTLAASGPGSLQAALDAPGPRTVVFAVSGVIDAEMIVIPHGDVTIAGQTAPGAGITIRGRLYAEYDESVSNIIIRHLRVRPPAFGGGDGSQYDAMQFSLASQLIFDHLSVSFGVDETIDVYESTDVTIQWSTISESATSGHPEGEHNYGLINGPDGTRVSVHHNLFAHHKNRNPALATGPCEVRNNVAYNVRHGFVHHNPPAGPFNIVGNVYRRGPADELLPFFFDDDGAGPGPGLAYYLHDNYVDDPGELVGAVDNPWAQPYLHPSFEYLSMPESFRVTSEIDFSASSVGWVPVTTHGCLDAYELVLERAGAFPRDAVVEQVVAETLARGGSWGARIPADLMAGLTAAQPPLDADGDGIADSWELAHGLDPTDGADHAAVMPSGYTAIEVYINELADALVGTAPGTADGGPPVPADGGGASDDDAGGATDGAVDDPCDAAADAPAPSAGSGGVGDAGGAPPCDGGARSAVRGRLEGGCGCAMRGAGATGGPPALALLLALLAAWRRAAPLSRGAAASRTARAARRSARGAR